MAIRCKHRLTGCMPYAQVKKRIDPFNFNAYGEEVVINMCRACYNTRLEQARTHCLRYGKEIKDERI